MAFSVGHNLKVWEVEPKTTNITRIKLTSSAKTKDGTYETDFSGFCVAIGSAAASKAAKLKAGDKIKLVSCAVSNRYDKEKKVTYHDYKIFDFEMAGNNGGDTQKVDRESPVPEKVDEGVSGDARLPF